MKLAGKSFRLLSNSANGSAGSHTVMFFNVDDEIVVGTYAGGAILSGHVVGRRLGEREIDLLYQGATRSGAIQAGRARACFETDADGRILMHLDWEWLTGDRSSGRSEWVST